MADERAANSSSLPAPPSTPLRVRVRYLVTLFVWAAAIVLFLSFFSSFKVILLGILAAACLAAALHPLAERIPGPRGAGAVVVGAGAILVAAGLVTLVSWLIAEPIQRELKRLPQLQQQLNGLLESWSSRLGLEDPITTQDILGQLRSFFAGGGGADVVSTTANVVTGVLIALVFVFIGTIYMLAEPRGRLIGPVLTLLPPHRRPQLRGALDDLSWRLRWWMIGTLFSITVVGIGAWIGYSIVGLEFALPLALLAGLAEIVPTVGPPFAAIVALLLAFTQGTGAAIGVVVVYLVLQGLESYVLLPLVMKKAVHIPPIVTLFSIILWAKVFGPAGLLLALPINLAIYSFVEHFLLKPRRHEPEPAAQAQEEV